MLIPSLKVMDISLGLTLLPSSRILTISLTVISSDKLYTPAFKLVLLLSLVYTLNIVTFLIRLLSFNVFAILLAAYTIYDIIKVELISLNPKSLTSLIITLIFIMDIAEKDVWYIRDTVALMNDRSFEEKELNIVHIFYSKLCKRVEYLEKI